MIKNFLIINCTGKNNIIALRVNNNFFLKKLQTNIRNNETLVNKIFVFVREKKANIKLRVVHRRLKYCEYWARQFFWN